MAPLQLLMYQPTRTETMQLLLVLLPLLLLLDGIWVRRRNPKKCRTERIPESSICWRNNSKQTPVESTALCFIITWDASFSYNLVVLVATLVAKWDDFILFWVDQTHPLRLIICPTSNRWMIGNFTQAFFRLILEFICINKYTKTVRVALSFVINSKQLIYYCGPFHYWTCYVQLPIFW